MATLPKGQPSMEAGILRTRLLDDAKIGIGISPEGEESLVLIPAFGYVVPQRAGAGQSEMGDNGSRQLGRCGQAPHAPAARVTEGSA